jgi:hypothetical protein
MLKPFKTRLTIEQIEVFQEDALAWIKSVEEPPFVILELPKYKDDVPAWVCGECGAFLAHYKKNKKVAEENFLKLGYENCEHYTECLYLQINNLTEVLASILTDMK